MKKFFMIFIVSAWSLQLFAADENTAVVSFSEASCPVGAVSENALFSVAAGKQVYFSKGNLQYQASTNTWRFAEHQYDFAGKGGGTSGTDLVMGNMGASNNNENATSSYTGWLDLFCWATPGYHDSDDNGNLYYYPYTINNADFGGGFGPSDGAKNIAGTNYDWGVYCPISNGGNEVGQWRTLTAEEWTYIVNRGESKISLGTVNGVCGVILLPDAWEGSSLVGAWFDWNKNVFDLETWTVMELNGAVFLPAAMVRTASGSINYSGITGKYWLASGCPSCYNPQKQGKCFSVTTGSALVSSPTANAQRSQGLSVRLVRDK